MDPSTSIATELFESKVGFQKYSGDIITQVEKDAELLASEDLIRLTIMNMRTAYLYIDPRNKYNYYFEVPIY